MKERLILKLVIHYYAGPLSDKLGFPFLVELADIFYDFLVCGMNHLP